MKFFKKEIWVFYKPVPAKSSCIQYVFKPLKNTSSHIFKTLVYFGWILLSCAKASDSGCQHSNPSPSPYQHCDMGQVISLCFSFLIYNRDNNNSYFKELM